MFAQNLEGASCSEQHDCRVNVLSRNGGKKCQKKKTCVKIMCELQMFQTVTV